MKKSASVPATLLMIASTAYLAGCSERRRCVDEYGNLLPETECNRYSGSRRMYGGRSIVPTWVYGGTYSNGRVMNASPTPRGGFGGGGFSGG